MLRALLSIEFLQAVENFAPWRSTIGCDWEVNLIFILLKAICFGKLFGFFFMLVFLKFHNELSSCRFFSFHCAGSRVGPFTPDLFSSALGKSIPLFLSVIASAASMCLAPFSIVLNVSATVFRVL